MTQGVTGTFAVNGTEFLMQPSEHRWVDRDTLGISGEARPVYPSVRKYSLQWNLMSMEDYAQVVGFYNSIKSSGSVIVDLPKYATSPYTFQSYTGCTLQEPTVGKYFTGWIEDVSLLILKVKTE